MIQSCQILNLSKISSLPTLSAFQEDLTNTESVMMMTKSNSGFFSNQTLRLMIWFGQFSNLFEVSSMSVLSASFRKNRSKLNKIHWWQSHCFFQQPRGHNSKINDPIRPVFELVWDFIHDHFICKFSGRSNQNLMTYADNNVKQRLFSAIKGLASFQSCLRFHLCPPYLQVSGTSVKNWMSYADDKIKQKLFQQ